MGKTKRSATPPVPHLRLSRVTIQNLKACKHCDLHLSDMTPLVGYNNAGKSTILEAIEWLLAKSKLDPADFGDAGQPVLVAGEIVGITNTVLEGLEDSHRKVMEEWVKGGRLWVLRRQAASGKPELQIRRTVYDVDNLSRDWDKNPRGIEEAIHAIFPEPILVAAMKEAEPDVGEAKASNTIGKLLKDVTDEIMETAGEDLQQALAVLRSHLEHGGERRLSKLADLDASITKQVRQFFPQLQGKFHIPAPSLSDVLTKASLKVGLDDGNVLRDFGSLGHGAQRAFQMALITHRARIGESQAPAPRTQLLLIDEPELYLHPHGIQVVRDGLERLSGQGYQIVYATHSPFMISEPQLPHAKLIRLQPDAGTVALNSMIELPELLHDSAFASQRDIITNVANGSEILFADQILIYEGKTETKQLPQRFREIAGSSFQSLGIGVISTEGSGAIAKTKSLLEAMGLPVKAIADLDYIRQAVQSKLIQPADLDMLKTCLASYNGPDPLPLGKDGFPGRDPSTEQSAAKSWELAAACPAIADAFRAVREKLLAQGIWLWPGGTIETHVGADKKSLKTGKLCPAQDEETLRTCFEWVRERPSETASASTTAEPPPDDDAGAATNTTSSSKKRKPRRTALGQQQPEPGL